MVPFEMNLNKREKVALLHQGHDKLFLSIIFLSYLRLKVKVKERARKIPAVVAKVGAIFRY